MEVLAIILARSGSKSVKDKNIRDMAGKPMIAWSIDHAIKCESINRVKKRKLRVASEPSLF